jgi:hypothetical protein
MNDTLTTSMISLDAAVERIARNARNGNLYPTIVYRDEADVTWRKLCALIPEERVRPLMLTADGFVQKADITQFAGFADKYFRFATILRYPPSDGSIPQVLEREPSYDLLDERGQLHRSATLIFSESELERELAPVSEPAGDIPGVAASPETPSFDEVCEADKSPFPVGSCGEHIEESLRAEHAADEPEATGGDEAHDDIEAECRVLASVTDDKIADFLKTAGCTNMNAAWALVKAKFPGVTQKRFRSIWKRNYFGGARGRRANCVA